MNVYEVITSGYTWWVAAEDDLEVLTLVRDELYNSELSDEEIDEALEEPEVDKLNQLEAKAIEVLDEYGDSMYTVWDLFLRNNGKGVLASDFRPDLLEESQEEF